MPSLKKNVPRLKKSADFCKLQSIKKLRVGPPILAALSAPLHPKLSLRSDNHHSEGRRGEVKLSASQLALAQGRYNKTKNVLNCAGKKFRVNAP